MTPAKALTALTGVSVSAAERASGAPVFTRLFALAAE
jgi:hypothetical protein